MYISLSQYPWKVKGFWPYVPFKQKSMELGQELMGVTDWLDATVPGGVHYDLLKAGMIEDPYYEQNSLKCEWVENRWWMYKTVFNPGDKISGKYFTLIFKGIDYKAHFYLNGHKLGVHEGMYEPAVFPVDDILKLHEDNELIVLFEHAPWEMPQIGYTSRTRTQKSRFNYKWDFGTRLVNIGIWDDVLLKTTGEYSIDDVFIQTDTQDDEGLISVSFFVNGKTASHCKARIFIDLEGKEIAYWENSLAVSEGTAEVSVDFRISNPRLWYPNGMGEQPLYRVTLEVFDADGLSDQREYHTGIRKLEYRKNQGSPSESLPYTFVVNGKPVYIKGVNLTPFDHLYGNVTRQTYRKYVDLIKRANINMVRIWGGGIIEKEYFYKLCDANGIMVWQEFIQSSSGIDNIPSLDPHFLQLLKNNAIHAVKEKRNHVCHTVWSGGNELMDENNVPITYDHPNIKMLEQIVKQYDPKKLFLPTSASGPNEYLNIEQPGMNHDVHGSWKYEGICRHYQIYNKSDSLFHSEFGVDGCSSMDSIKKMMGPEHWKVTDMTENLVWRHHGEWWDTRQRDESIFGKFKSLEQFVKASQFIQAEGLRCILEANRRRKFCNSGSIIWQFNEPWPNVSCTSLVEYYGRPKMAYYWVRQSYTPVHASLAYDKLVWKPDETFTGRVFINNSLLEREFTIVWEILDVYGNVLLVREKKEIIQGNSVNDIDIIKYNNPRLDHGIFFVRLRVKDTENNIIDENLYIFSQEQEYPFASLINMDQGKLSVQKTSEGYRIKNVGDIVVPFIYGFEEEGKAWIFIKDNYTTLFPGEEHDFTVELVEGNEPDLTLDALSIAWDSFVG